MKTKELFPTQHMVGHMNLDVPLTVKHHLTFDALVCLLLQTRTITNGLLQPNMNKNSATHAVNIFHLPRMIHQY